jgi:demethylmenaquinone methyltransferase / 2-methoxy-6-polyprenyl-1,4-benzoquinol methylase
LKTIDVSRSRTHPNEFARSLFADLPARYDVLAEVLSFGQNRRWRRAMVDHVAAANPSLVLDVACGPAGVTKLIASRTAANVIGIDQSEEMLIQGVRSVERDDLGTRIEFVLGRGEQLPFADGSFDSLTFTYLLRYVADPAATLAELARVVRPGGEVASLEFAVPSKPWWRGAWWFYSRVVLPIAGFALGGRAWFDVGRFLGPSITEHYRNYPIDWTVSAWERAGIGAVSVRRMSLGGGLVMSGRRTS